MSPRRSRTSALGAVVLLVPLAALTGCGGDSVSSSHVREPDGVAGLVVHRVVTLGVPMLLALVPTALWRRTEGEKAESRVIS